MTDSKLDAICINTLRFLAVDAVEMAKSGHPGAPLGAAPMAYVLWDRFLKHNPDDPQWPNRDRFILSAGHASSLLYALLHLTGYDLSLDDMKQFRQWGSKTPGHPEYGVTPGVEATTGPLGQGFAMGVGMALAERWLAKRFNLPGFEIINHYTYVLVSDGDLQEGISSEAASFAGTMRLGKLIYLYDDNHVSIEGNTDLTFTEDVGQRFRAYGWQVLGPVEGTDTEEIDAAIRSAKSDPERPSLIICHTIIGYGSPNKAGKAIAHGEPLGAEELILTKKNLSWPYSDLFIVPPDALAHFRLAKERGQKLSSAWKADFEAYRRSFAEDAQQMEQDLKGNLPAGWDSEIDDAIAQISKPTSTREVSGKVLNILAKKVACIIGGSADLAPSTKTFLNGCNDFSCDDYSGRNIHFGIREHAMGGICNGIALHRGLIPYGSTFLVFSDYMKPAIRLTAMMKLKVIYVFSHDSIGVGEDGPTHQPIEQLLSLRAIPNLLTIRPADAIETAEAWKIALEHKTGPSALILSRQNLPILDRTKMTPASGIKRGGYVLWENGPSVQAIIIATGSEVHIAMEAGGILRDKGVNSRVVSLPSWQLFDTQPLEYRESVIPSNITKRTSVEAGTPLGWDKYVGSSGITIGISHFGASAPAKILYENFDITAEHIVKSITDTI